MASSEARISRIRSGRSSTSQRCLRASARNSNSRVSAFSSAAGSWISASAAACSLSSASPASITARSSDASASASNGCSPPIRSSLRAADRNRASGEFDPSQTMRNSSRSPASFSPFCMSARTVASCASSPSSGASAFSSARCASSKSWSSFACAIASCASASASRASRHFVQAGAIAATIRPGIAIQQHPVPARIDQPAIIMLSVQFHQHARHFAQQRHADRLVVHERLGPAIRLELAADQQRLARFRFDIGVVQYRGQTQQAAWRIRTLR